MQPAVILEDHEFLTGNRASTVRIATLVVAALIWQIALSEAGPSGRVCIASVAAPNDQSKSLANPSGGNPDVVYSVKVADRSPIEISRESGLWLEGLPLNSRLPVIIYEDGERTASFARFSTRAATSLTFGCWSDLYPTELDWRMVWDLRVSVASVNILSVSRRIDSSMSRVMKTIRERRSSLGHSFNVTGGWNMCWTP